MKMVMTAAVANLHCCQFFGKPFNPVLGETFEAFLADGSHIAAEQISHHPPITALNQDGPNGLYFVSGWNQVKFVPSINSANMEMKGGKTIKFADGSSISFNNVSDRF